MSDPLPPMPKGMDDVLKLAHQMAQNYLPDEDFVTIFENDRRWAAERQLEGGIEGNMLVVHGIPQDNKGDRVLLPIQFNDWPPPKTVDGQPFGVKGAMAALAVLFTGQYPKHYPMCVSHIAEGHMALGRKSRDEIKGRIEEEPDAIEVAIVSMMSMDQRKAASYRAIERNPDGSFKDMGKEYGRGFEPGKYQDPRQLFDNAVEAFYHGYFRMLTGGVPL